MQELRQLSPTDPTDRSSALYMRLETAANGGWPGGLLFNLCSENLKLALKTGLISVLKIQGDGMAEALKTAAGLCRSAMKSVTHSHVGHAVLQPAFRTGTVVTPVDVVTLQP